MQIVVSTFKSEYEVKKSIFIAYILPMNGFENLRQILKAEHPKAAHIVWALRYLNEFGQIVENGSDDGEPKGTSAQPVLNVLRGMDIINSAVLVVRYFGGIKLGTGGLVRAYGTAVKMALREAEFLFYAKKEKFCFSCKYAFVQKFEYFLKKLGVLHEREFEADKVRWTTEVTSQQKEELEKFLKESSF